MRKTRLVRITKKGFVHKQDISLLERHGLLCPRCQRDYVTEIPPQIYCCMCSLGASGDSKERQAAWEKKSEEDKPKRPEIVVSGPNYFRVYNWKGITI